jgi:hypothetical protein
MLLLIIILTSCRQKSQYFLPPTFLGIDHITDQSITLSFDKPVVLSHIDLDSALTLRSNSHHTIFFDNVTVGRHYNLQGTANSGNASVQFSMQFIGLSDTDPALALINELSIIHNKTITDAIELRVLTSGNLAGTTVYIGTPKQHSARYIFGDTPVQAGELIVLHADKTEGHFFAGSPRLGNTREIISLAKDPYSVAYYAIAYENASSAGANSAQAVSFRANLEYLFLHDLWQGSPIDSDNATATRSLSRTTLALQNPESASAWYTTDTRGSSIGRANNTKVFVPKPKARASA